MAASKSIGTIGKLSAGSGGFSRGRGDFGRRDDDGQGRGDKHDDGDGVQSARVRSGGAQQFDDELRTKVAGAAPRREHEAVDGANVLRAEVVGGKCGHGAEAAAVAHKDDEGNDSDDGYRTKRG